MISFIKACAKTPLTWAAAQLGSHKRDGNEPHLWVLMYHRILPAEDSRYHAEEPGMIVAPETFHQQLQSLKQLMPIMPLQQWLDRFEQGLTLPPRACAITFDDGWVDNFEYALPIIEQQQVPITLFAVSDMIGTSRQFWPNRLNHLLTQATRRQLQSLSWLEPLLPSEPSTDGEHSNQSLNDSSKPLNREQIADVIRQIKRHPDDKISLWLSEAEQQLAISIPATAALMDWQQLKIMAASDYVDIGSHTCNHYRLRDDLNPEITEREIVASKHRLEDELQQSINLFCYPNGDTSALAVELVKKHYQAAVTTQRGINKQSSLQPHQLARIGLHQDISDSNTKLKAKLANWF